MLLYKKLLLMTFGTGPVIQPPRSHPKRTWSWRHLIVCCRVTVSCCLMTLPGWSIVTARRCYVLLQFCYCFCRIYFHFFSFLLYYLILSLSFSIRFFILFYLRISLIIPFLLSFYFILPLFVSHTSYLFFSFFSVLLSSYNYFLCTL